MFVKNDSIHTHVCVYLFIFIFSVDEQTHESDNGPLVVCEQLIFDVAQP